MPTFDQEVDATFDISPSDFVSECSSREIKELIGILVEGGHLPEGVAGLGKSNGYSADEFQEAVRKLSKNYYSITKEEEDIIKNIAKRF